MENEKGVPEVDSPLLTHLLFYVPQISQIFDFFKDRTGLQICVNLWDIKIFSEKKSACANIIFYSSRNDS